VYITSHRIQNYKSYFDSGRISFGQGFNLLLGQNDAGKTALLESLNLRHGHPFKSLGTHERRDSPVNTTTTTEVTFWVPPEDLRRLTPAEFTINTSQNVGDPQTVEALKRAFRKGTEMGVLYHNGAIARAWVVELGLSEQGTVGRHLRVLDGGSVVESRGSSSGHAASATLPAMLADRLRQRVYAFKAERLSLAEGELGPGEVLEPDARNLPQVLNYLSSKNKLRFKRYVEMVATVFPHISDVTVPTGDANRSTMGSVSGQILLWTVPPESDRDDLAIPLSASGTGIGQVLAMLYVLATANEDAKVLLIDEPQSFLHPGAQRKLFEIFAQHGRHQYIVTTHSPTIVSSVDVSSMYLVRRHPEGSRVEPISASSSSDLRAMLAEVGARLSDVFGADQILWVEGPTEEAAFPLILSALGARIPAGTKVIGLIHTGDLGKRHAEISAQVYRRLAGGEALLPPALAILLDAEDKTSQHQAELHSKSEGAVRFLPRRMYENYLLAPEAIASLISELDLGSGKPVEAAHVQDWIEKLGTDRRYLGAEYSKAPVFSAIWLKQVDAGRLLSDLFQSLTDARVEYRKMLYGEQLTRKILAATPKHFEELSNFLSGLLKPGP
jgi:hypothetical protein